MTREEVTNITKALKAVIQPKLDALDARLLALEGGSDSLLHARIKLLESENAAMARRLAGRIPQAPRRRA